MHGQSWTFHPRRFLLRKMLVCKVAVLLAGLQPSRPRVIQTRRVRSVSIEGAATIAGYLSIYLSLSLYIYIYIEREREREIERGRCMYCIMMYVCMHIYIYIHRERERERKRERERERDVCIAESAFSEVMLYKSHDIKMQNGKVGGSTRADSHCRGLISPDEGKPPNVSTRESSSRGFLPAWTARIPQKGLLTNSMYHIDKYTLVVLLLVVVIECCYYAHGGLGR